MKKEERIKLIDEISKFLKKADIVEIKVVRGFDSKMDPKTWMMVNRPTGSITITIEAYNKEDDKRDELPKETKLTGLG